MHNLELVLPIDVKYNKNKNASNDCSQELFDFAIFDVVISSAIKVRASIIDDGFGKIKKAQEKQKRDFDRRHLSKAEIHADDNLFIVDLMAVSKYFQ